MCDEATGVSTLLSKMGNFLQGSFFNTTFDIRARDCIDVILIPSNQRVLAEISNPQPSTSLAELLMTYRVLPEIRKGSAATSFGFHLLWTFGIFRRSKSRARG